MKKFTLILATALMSMGAMAQHTLNNPVGADGRYIVKYDCAADQFAAANDMEADETFTFAVDVTGTWLEDFLKGTPAAEGASRGIAINKWTNVGPTPDATARMKQIKGNIWGMTVNYVQLFPDQSVLVDVLKTDSVLYVSAQIFGFEYTEDNPGAGWWMWAEQLVDETKVAGSDCLFAFAPYTGTKTSAEFYADDYEEGIYGSGEKGYAAPCVDASTTAVENVELKQQGAKFIENGQMYIMHNGVKYNALGAQVK